jgi:hypothetical protein
MLAYDAHVYLIGTAFRVRHTHLKSWTLSSYGVHVAQAGLEMQTPDWVFVSPERGLYFLVDAASRPSHYYFLFLWQIKRRKLSQQRPQATALLGLVPVHVLSY